MNFENLISMSIGFASLAWILDSLMDSLIFHEGTVFDQIIAPTNNEIGIRLLFGSVFIVFGIYIQSGITRFKKAEDALKVAVINAEDEKNKTKAIIEAIGDGIILQDIDYKIVYQNQVQVEIYGNRVGEYCYKAYEGKDSICEDCPIEVSFKDGKIHKTERKVPTDKGILDIELTGSPLRDSTGKIIGGVKVVRDITELKKTEESLKLFSEAIEEAPEGVQIVDLSGHIIYSNKAIEQIYGFSPAEYKGKHVNEMNVDPEFANSVIIPSIRETGRWVGDLMVKHRDGHAFPIWLTASMIRNNKGEPIAIVGIISDITDRKRMEEELRRAHDELELRIQERTAELVKTNKTLQAEITERKSAEEALKQSEEKYRKLIDNIQDGVFIIQDAKIQFANEAFARVAGYTVEEVIGKNYRQLVAPEDLEKLADRYHRRLAGEDLPPEYEFHAMHKDGKTRIFINMNVGLITYRGRVASMGTVKDITEKKKLESQLLRAQRMESIGTLASGIAHDINNVLTPIMLSQELLRDRLTPNSAHFMYHAAISDCSRHLLNFKNGT